MAQDSSLRRDSSPLVTTNKISKNLWKQPKKQVEIENRNIQFNLSIRVLFHIRRVCAWNTICDTVLKVIRKQEQNNTRIQRLKPEAISIFARKLEANLLKGLLLDKRNSLELFKNRKFAWKTLFFFLKNVKNVWKI